MTKVKNFGRKFFLVGIDSECFETYFKTKISKSKIFTRHKIFFLGICHFLIKIVKKWKSQKFLFNFFVKIDSERSETYFRTKISKSNFFPLQNYFLGLSHFHSVHQSNSEAVKGNMRLMPSSERH